MNRKIRSGIPDIDDLLDMEDAELEALLEDVSDEWHISAPLTCTVSVIEMTSNLMGTSERVGLNLRPPEGMTHVQLWKDISRALRQGRPLLIIESKE